MRMETILNVHLPDSFVGVSVSADALAKIIQDAFAKTYPVYAAVHVHTSDGPLIFRREAGVVITRDLVARRANEASFYLVRDRRDTLVRSMRRSW